ncbi:MAG: class I SAM-dependent methyltransferase [Promethearchaeota archaeon]
MKEINKILYLNISEISEVFHQKITEDEIEMYFEAGKINGLKIENEWHADQEAIDHFVKNVVLKERSYNVGLHIIDLSDIKLDGRILDIGGGGRAIISQFKGEQVVAIDPNENELKEAPDNKALKVIMNAKELQFLDNTFDTVTAFFTFMYIPMEDFRIIFEEIRRVLKKGGHFVIWDVLMPKRGNDKRDIFFIELRVKLFDTIGNAGYGVSWNKEINPDTFTNLAKNIGFETLERKVDNDTIFIRFRKN